MHCFVTFVLLVYYPHLESVVFTFFIVWDLRAFLFLKVSICMDILDLTTASTSDEDINVFNPKYWGDVSLLFSVKGRKLKN